MSVPPYPEVTKETIERFFLCLDGANNVVKILLIGEETPKLASKSINSISKGSSSDFEITVDLDEAPIPNRIYILGVVVIASADTIFRVRLFAKDSRALDDPMWFERSFGWTDSNYFYDATGFWYFNLKNDNKIYGQIAVSSNGANDAAFEVFILFREGA